MYTHKQVQLVYSGVGLGEAFLSVHPQLSSSFRQPQENTRCPKDEGLYMYTYVCVCVCVDHALLTQR